MTLLEALLATVILSVVAIACLEGTRGAASLQYAATSTTAGVARAEAVLAQVEAGAPVDPRDAQVSRLPYRAPGATTATRLDRVDVVVPVAGGRTVHLTRLLPRTTSASRPPVLR